MDWLGFGLAVLCLEGRILIPQMNKTNLIVLVDSGRRYDRESVASWQCLPSLNATFLAAESSRGTVSRVKQTTMLISTCHFEYLPYYQYAASDIHSGLRSRFSGDAEIWYGGASRRSSSSQDGFKPRPLLETAPITLSSMSLPGHLQI